MTELQKEKNKEKSRIRARVEHVFEHMNKAMKGLSSQKIGLRRNAFMVSVKNLAYNISRWTYLSNIQNLDKLIPSTAN